MSRPRGPADLSNFDEIVVLRLMAGHRVFRPSTADRTEAVRRLVLKGYSDGQVAHATGLWRNSVWRIRAERLKLPPAVGRWANGTSCTVAAPTRPKVLR